MVGLLSGHSRLLPRLLRLLFPTPLPMKTSAQATDMDLLLGYGLPLRRLVLDEGSKIFEVVPVLVVVNRNYLLQNPKILLVQDRLDLVLLDLPLVGPHQLGTWVRLIIMGQITFLSSVVSFLR